MATDQKQSSGSKFLITAAAFVIVVAGMRAAEAILIPFFIAVFVAVICLPSLHWFRGKGIPHIIAILIVISMIALIGMLMATFIGTSLADFSSDLPQYQAQLQEKARLLVSWLGKKGIEMPENWISDTFNPGAAMNFAAGLLSRLGNVFTNAFLIFLTVIFILIESSSISGKLRVISNDTQKSNTPFDTFIKNVNRYMAIKTLTSLATGVAIAILLMILGVDYPLLWGVLAFILNFVPNIGSIIAAVPALLLAFVQIGVATALWSGIGYVAINLLVGSIIEPKVMGRGIGLSTLVVFLSLVFWGWVLGPVGMLLSVPLTITVKIALDSRDDTRWISILLGPEVPFAEPVVVSETSDQKKAGSDNNKY